MSKRDDRISLRDMLGHAEEAVQLLGSSPTKILSVPSALSVAKNVSHLTLKKAVRLVSSCPNQLPGASLALRE